MATSRAALKTKRSAVRAGVSASTILVTGLAGLVLTALVYRAFDGRWKRLDWQLALKFIGVISVLWFLVMFVSNLVDLRASDRREEARNPSLERRRSFGSFFPPPWDCLGCAFGVSGKQHEPLWSQGLSLSFAMLAFFGWPRTITLDEVGVSQRSLFGIRRTIPYREVEGMSYEPDQQVTQVVGIGATIKHTTCHSDAALFQSLMEERMGKQVYG